MTAMSLIALAIASAGGVLGGPRGRHRRDRGSRHARRSDRPRTRASGPVRRSDRRPPAPVGIATPWSGGPRRQHSWPRRHDGNVTPEAVLQEFDGLRALARSLVRGDADADADADDLLQDTAIAALEHPPADDRRPVLAWLAAVLATACAWTGAPPAAGTRASTPPPWRDRTASRPAIRAPASTRRGRSPGSQPRWPRSRSRFTQHQPAGFSSSTPRAPPGRFPARSACSPCLTSARAVGDVIAICQIGKPCYRDFGQQLYSGSSVAVVGGWWLSSGKERRRAHTACRGSGPRSTERCQGARRHRSRVGDISG